MRLSIVRWAVVVSRCHLVYGSVELIHVYPIHYWYWLGILSDKNWLSFLWWDCYTQLHISLFTFMKLIHLDLHIRKQGRETDIGHLGTHVQWIFVSQLLSLLISSRINSLKPWFYLFTIHLIVWVASGSTIWLVSCLVMS